MPSDPLVRTVTMLPTGGPNYPVTKLMGPDGRVFDLKAIAIRGRLFWIGRAATNAIKLPYETVSKVQCSISFEFDGRVMCTHNPKAKNPTAINGSIFTESAELKYLSKLSMGNTVFTVLAEVKEIQDAHALQLYNKAGGDAERGKGSLASVATQMGIPRTTAADRIDRAKAFLAGVVPEKEIHDERSTPVERPVPNSVSGLPPVPKAGKRHRTHGEYFEGVPTTQPEGVPTTQPDNDDDDDDDDSNGDAS